MRISVQNGDTHLSIEWYRTPFGLEQWAEANVGGNKELYHALNDYHLKLIDDEGRKRVYDVVMSYAERIRALDFSRFRFSYDRFLAYVVPYMHTIPLDDKHRIPGSVWHWGTSTVGPHLDIPCHLFKKQDIVFYAGTLSEDNATIHECYQSWFGQLVQIAEATRDGGDFWCHND